MSKLSKRIASLSDEKQILLKRKLNTIQPSDSLLPIEPRNSTINEIPLSSAQQNILFDSMRAKETGLYNESYLINIKGSFDPKIFRNAIKILISRHEVFRLLLVGYDSRTYQRLGTEPLFEYREHDLLSSSEFVDDHKLKDLLELESRRAFDLEIGPFIRYFKWQTDEDVYKINLIFHHLIIDGWSLHLFFKETFDIYQNLRKGIHCENPPISLQYGDYVDWEQQWFRSSDYKRQFAYWQGEFPDVPETLQLPIDFSSQDETQPGEEHNILLDSALVSNLTVFCRKEGISLFSTLLSVLFLLLHKICNQNDLTIGVPFANRSHPDTVGILGNFVNTVIIRGRINRTMTFRELAKRVFKKVVGASNNQSLPIYKLNNEIATEPSNSRDPITQVLFSYLDQPQIETEFDDFNFNVVRLHNGGAKFPISLIIGKQKSGEISGVWEYRSDLFRNDTIARINSWYYRLIESVIDEPEQYLEAYSILSDEERLDLVYKSNTGSTPSTIECTIPQCFVEQVKRYPDRLAVIRDDQKFTYRELNQFSNFWANHLLKLDLEFEEPVAIMTDREPWLLGVYLGILKAGGAYLPISPDYPTERINYILEDSEVRFLIANEGYAEVSDLRFAGRIMSNNLFEAIDVLDEVPDPKPSQCPSPHSLAYLLYTSGTTGVPKGVLIEHCSVARLVLEVDYTTLSDGVRILSTGSPVFDATTFEYWGALLNGGTLYLASKYDVLDPSQLKVLIKENKINIMWLTASLFSQLCDVDPNLFKNLDELIVGGEVVCPQRVARVRAYCPELVVINGYGPTECTTFALCYRIEPEESNPSTNVPIGRAINHTRVYILDSMLHPCPVGLTGDLYLGGVGLARNYLKRPDLNESCFREDPFLAGKQIYRTGDRARWLPDGNIEFIGRIDEQIKMRGYRIELGEIENALLAVESIREAVVLAKEQKGNKSLVAYFVGDGDMDESLLRKSLKMSLPDYMIPEFFMKVQEIPLTSNGKMDRNALPDPDWNRAISVDYIPPRNKFEKKLCKIWGRILHVNKIGIYDNFFELGGNSLNAIECITIIERDLKVKIPVVRLMADTLEELANFCSLSQSSLISILEKIKMFKKH